ncbi:hypothetical protein, partial [Candidatus Neptunochlamydia vexilliferae]
MTTEGIQKKYSCLGWESTPLEEGVIEKIIAFVAKIFLYLESSEFRDAFSKEAVVRAWFKIQHAEVTLHDVAFLRLRLRSCVGSVDFF